MKSKIYAADVTALSDESLYQSMLARVRPERLEKINKAAAPTVKRQLLGAGILLLYVLSLEGLDGNRVSIEKGPHGKPFISESGIHYNLSHSGRYVLCALSDSDVGCDVEMTESRHSRDSVAKRFFHDDEYALLTNCSTPADRELLFYRLWTLKESFMKVTGLGMALPLNEFCIEFSEPVTVRHNVDDRTYFFREYTLSGACASCSIAGEVPPEELIIVDFNELV